MILNLLFQDPAIAIVFLLGIALAISVHEAAHAWTANHFGDPTAKHLGRITLNPLAHLDPVGTLLLVIAGFGWGKPVPVDDRHFKRRSDMTLVALAGPASNLILAVIFALAFRLIGPSPMQTVLGLFIFLNLGLMIFNLIPIPPLDGSKLLRLFVSRETYLFLEQYGFMLIILLFFVLRFGSLGLADWLTYAVNALFQILTGYAGLAL